MSVKSLFGSFGIHLLLAGILMGWFGNDNLDISLWPPGIKIKDDSGLIEKVDFLQKRSDSLDTDNRIREGIIENQNYLIGQKVETIDSLEVVIQGIRKDSRDQVKKFEERIEKDSAETVIIFREALKNLGIVSDFTKHLTFREIGHGAIFLSKYPGLQLELKETRTKFDELKDAFDLRRDMIKQLREVNVNTKKQLELSKSQTGEYKVAYESATSFWNDRIILGIGYGVQMGLNDRKVTHGPQAGFFIKMWGL